MESMKKIKLAAFDMDGTLLNSQNKPPEGFNEFINRRSDVKFVAASGRQYLSVRKILENAADNIVFVAENGAVIIEENKTIHLSPIDNELVRGILDRVVDVSGIYIVLGCEHSSYIQNPPEEIMADMRKYNEKIDIVDDIYDVLGRDNILNIALYSYMGAKEKIMPLMRGIDKKLRAVLSADSWVDVISNGVNKGSAIKFLQEHFGILPEECAAFGDYMNDYEMLESCAESYAMANACEEIKKIAKHTAPSNDEEGVLRVLERIL